MSGMATVATGNSPRVMEPVTRRFDPAGSSAMEVRPVPGMKVEKRRPSPAGVSLVRKPEVAPVVAGMISGTRALSVG
jgi:hypothetical protein